MRSNSHVLAHFSEVANNGYATTEGSANNEPILRRDSSSKLVGEGGTNSSQDSMKR